MHCTRMSFLTNVLGSTPGDIGIQGRSSNGVCHRDEPVSDDSMEPVSA